MGRVAKAFGKDRGRRKAGGSGWSPWVTSHLWKEGAWARGASSHYSVLRKVCKTDGECLGLSYPEEHLHPYRKGPACPLIRSQTLGWSTPPHPTPEQPWSEPGVDLAELVNSASCRRSSEHPRLQDRHG